MKQFQKMLVIGLLFALTGATIFSLPDDYAKDSASLQKLQAGTVVALYAKQWNKYLKLAKGPNAPEYRFLTSTGTDKNDPMCQFQIVRSTAQPNWIFLKSLQAEGKNLQLAVNSPHDRIAQFANHNVGSWEQFALEPTTPDSLDGVRLRNKATDTWLCAVAPDRFEGRVAGNWAPNAASGAGSWELFKIEIVNEVKATDHPGGTEFTFKRAMRDRAQFAFDDKWHFKNPKKGLVKFKAKAALDIYVGFSPAPNFTGDSTYSVIIGGWQNTQSVICHGWIKDLVKRTLNSGGLDSDMVTGGWGAEGLRLHTQKIKGEKDWEKDGNYQGNEWDDYWASYEVANGKVIIAWGKGAVAYKNERMRAEHDNKEQQGFEYLGLGGWFLDVEYKDIQIDPEATVDEQTISTVADLEKIEGSAHRIALGADDGKYLAMMVAQADRKLYKMSPKTMGGWELVEVKDKDDGVAPAKFEDVSVANDGTVGVLADDGVLFISYDGGATWDSLGAPVGPDGKAIDIDRVAIASKNLIAILDKETAQVFVYDAGLAQEKGVKRSKDKKKKKNVSIAKDDKKSVARWESVGKGNAISIAAAYPDILFAVNKNLDVYRLVGKDWTEIKNPNQIGRFAIIDEDDMYGTVQASDGQYYLYKCEKNVWEPVLDTAKKPVVGIKEVVVNAAGAMLIMNIKGEILKKGILDIPVSLSEDKIKGKKNKEKTSHDKRNKADRAGKKAKRKHALDRDRDGKVSEQERNAADTDHDGKISKKERQAARGGTKAKRKHALDRDGDGKVSEEERKAADSDGDGKISKKERQAARAGKKAKRKHALDRDGDGKVSEQERKAADSDGDGKVSKQERKAARMARDAAKKAKKKHTLDRDGDGKVSEQEVVDYVEESNPHDKKRKKHESEERKR